MYMGKKTDPFIIDMNDNVYQIYSKNDPKFQ